MISKIKLSVFFRLLNLGYILLLISEFGILVDVFFFKKKSDLVIFPLLFFFILGSIKLRLKAKSYFFNALFFLIISQLSSVFQNDLTPDVTIVEKLALWVYLFLLIGVIKQTTELYHFRRLKK